MLTLYLIRHGNKEAIPFDPPLTLIGKKQAEVTAEYLKNVPFTKVFASPKTRTRQTAEIIAKPQGLPVILDPRLQERLEWEKEETFDEFISEWSKTDLDRSYQPANGESSSGKGTVMESVIEDLSPLEDATILIVSHGGSIGDLLRRLFGEEAVPHPIDPITGAPHILIGECSITQIEKNGDKYKLVKLGNIDHLSSPLV
jgi:broad specificity phosphatase PhoE